MYNIVQRKIYDIFFKQGLLIGICSLGIFVLFFGCGGESEIAIKEKLDVVIASDLKTITSELPKTSLADSMFVTFSEYKKFKRGPYRALAIVEFHYLRDVKVLRRVKYRYGNGAQKWERYSNEYVL